MPKSRVLRESRFIFVLLRVLKWSTAMRRRTTFPFLVIFILLVKLLDAISLKRAVWLDESKLTIS